MKSTLITHSRIQAFQDCPRLHRFKYVDGLRPVATSEALSFGTLIHKALELWWKGGEERLMYALGVINGEEDPYIRARAKVLMTAYHVRWVEDSVLYRVIAVEKEFRFEAGGHDFAGKVDVIVRRLSDDTLWGIEHKTSGADLSPGSSYWTRLRMDGQVSLYHDGIAATEGEEPSGILYDVIEKPDIRPLKATSEAAKKYKKDGTLYANQREVDETPEEFEQRLMEAVSASPERYLQRAEVIRLATELDQARFDVEDVAEMIRDAEAKHRHPRNVSACKRYGRDCEYIMLCSGMASADDETLYKIGKIHPELE